MKYVGGAGVQHYCVARALAGRSDWARPHEEPGFLQWALQLWLRDVRDPERAGRRVAIALVPRASKLNLLKTADQKLRKMARFKSAMWTVYDDKENISLWEQVRAFRRDSRPY
jgi:hypothetical protein